MSTAHRGGLPEVLVVVPARGGSKGLPRKNLVRIAGHNLIEYAAACIQGAHTPLHAVLSSDSAEILDWGVRCGIEIVRRPAHLAQDDSPVVDAVLHALEEMERRHGTVYRIVVLLQPTSPFRTGADLDAVVRLCREEGVDSVISVVEEDDHHPARMYRLRSGLLEPFLPAFERARRQDIPPAYYRNGCFYAVRREALMNSRQLITGRKKPYLMPRQWLCNIDDQRDLMLAELMAPQWLREVGLFS